MGMDVTNTKTLNDCMDELSEMGEMVSSNCTNSRLRLLNLADIEAAPDPEIMIQSPSGMPLLYRDGFTAITALSGVGKTTFITLMLFGEGAPEMKVLWVDTEQTTPWLKKTIGKIAQYRGKRISELQNLFVASGVGMSPDDWKGGELRELVESIRPDVVVLDNIADAISDSTSEDEARTWINQCVIPLCEEYHCGVLGVVHKAPSTGKIKGHIGTIATQKCVLGIELNGTGSEVTVTTFKTRGSRAYTATDGVRVEFDSYGLMHWMEYKPEEYTQSEAHWCAADAKRERFRELFGGKSMMYQSELANILCKSPDMNGNLIKRSAAYNQINSAASEGVLRIIPNDAKPRKPFVQLIDTTPQPEQQVLPLDEVEE